MNNKERLELAKWAAGQAQKAGASDAAVNISQSRDIEVEVRDGQIDQLNESTRNSLSISIYADNRYSDNSTNDLRKDSLTKFIESLVATTRYLGEDKFRTLPDPKYYTGQNKIDLKLLDPGYQNVTSEQRVKIAKDLESIAHAQSEKIISCSASYYDSYSESVKFHTNGFEGERNTTIFQAGATVTIDDGEGGRPQDWNYGTTRFLNSLPDYEKLAKGAATRALRKIGQSKMESGKYEMVVENRSMGRLVSALYGPMQGRAIQQKKSFLDGKLGEQIGSSKLTFIDDPFIVSGLGSRLFDGEGIATKKRIIIDKGVLKDFFIDNYYGNKLGVAATSGGTTNMTFDSGSKSLEEMISSMKKGLLVTGFIGGNSNSTTGDYSYGIVGQYVENGKIIKPVNEMNVSGNLLDLWGNLVDVGNDPYMYSSWRLPSMRFENIQFSGI